MLCDKLKSDSVDDNVYDNFVDINIIQDLISKMSGNKAMGHDNLSAEHLKYGHPVIVASVNSLFKIFMMCNYVPDGFGVGILVPIPKDDSKTCLINLDDFRRITISPVISKLFESVVLHVIGQSHLSSSNS